MYLETTITGRPKVPLAEQQVRARAKASNQRNDYALKLGNVTVKPKDGSQARRIGTVEVRNLKSGACYTVAFLPKSRPLCNCPIALKQAGSGYCCKHVLMAEEFVGMSEEFELASEEQEEEPAEEMPLFKIEKTANGRWHLLRRYGHNYGTCMHGPGFRTKREAGENLKAAFEAEEPKPPTGSLRESIGNPALDTKVVQEQDGLFYVHRIYGDGRYGFERQLSAFNPGRETEAEAEADLRKLKSIRADAGKKPLSAYD